MQAHCAQRSPVQVGYHCYSAVHVQEEQFKFFKKPEGCLSTENLTVCVEPGLESDSLSLMPFEALLTVWNQYAASSRDG